MNKATNSTENIHNNRTALITGSARRIGAAIARQLHAIGFNIIIHHRNSQSDAKVLCADLNALRANSACSLSADLSDLNALNQFADSALKAFGNINVLINNASSFYPTPLGATSEADWDDLLGSNLKAPFFLAQRLAPELKKQHGCIINMADIHAERPLKNHTLYCCAKAGNVMLTKSLARELAPDIRVNGIAPGAILWPEQALAADEKNQIVERTALKRAGSEQDIVDTVCFLIDQSSYITGQIISVDGGRTLSN